MPVWMGTDRGRQSKELALAFVREYPGKSTDEVAKAIEESNGFTYSCLMGLFTEGKVKPVLVAREDPTAPRRRLWYVEDPK
jgi:hypothetical protein